jgi:hypothetical protein
MNSLRVDLLPAPVDASIADAAINEADVIEQMFVCIVVTLQCTVVITRINQRVKFLTDYTE